MSPPLRYLLYDIQSAAGILCNYAVIGTGVI